MGKRRNGKRPRQPGLAVNMDDYAIEFDVPASEKPTRIRVAKVPRKQKLAVQTEARLTFREDGK